MPDFRVQQSFPVASYIDAAQRKGQMDNQTTLAQSELFNQAIGKIGEIANTMYERKKRVAQSLALGKELGLSDELSRTAEPEQLLKAKGIQVDMKKAEAAGVPSDLVLSGLAARLGIRQAIPTPSVSSSPVTQNSNGPMLTSDMTATPVLQDQPELTPPATGQALIPPMTGQVPVPIKAPPVLPSRLNSQTVNFLMKMADANRKEGVYQYTPGVGLEKVGEKKKGDQVITSQPRAEDGGIDNPKYQAKLEKQYADMRLKPLSNRSGGLGLQDSKVNQAFDLRKLVNKYYDPKTGDFNVPPSQHAELALGLARLVSPTGQVGIELMHELRQSTGREALAKAMIYAGADPTKVGGPTQSVVKMFVDSVDRQGQTAEQLRDQYMSYISDNAPVDLDPGRKAKHDKGRLNSFNEFLSKAPDKMAHGGGPTGYEFSDAEKERKYQEWKAKKSL